MGDQCRGILNCVSEDVLCGEMSDVMLRGFHSVDHSELKEYCGASLTLLFWVWMGSLQGRLSMGNG